MKQAASRRSQCVLGAERFVTALCPLGIVTALVIDTFCCKMASFFNACPVQSDSLLPCARSVSLLPQLAIPWKAHNLFQLLNVSRKFLCRGQCPHWPESSLFWVDVGIDPYKLSSLTHVRRKRSADFSERFFVGSFDFSRRCTLCTSRL